MRVSIFVLATALIGVVSCTKPPATGGEPRLALPDLPPNEYTVCDVGEIGAHGTLEGFHVEVGDVVEVKSMGKEGVTQVCLRGACSSGTSNANLKQLWMTANGPRIQAVDWFDHTKAGMPEKEFHLVKLERADTTQMSTGLKAKCMKETVLQLQFCPLKADGSDFECEPVLPHQGGAHIEN